MKNGFHLWPIMATRGAARFAGLWSALLFAGSTSSGFADAKPVWDTPEGQVCIDNWAAETSARLNAHRGTKEFNDRKPWSFNRFGLLEGGAWVNGRRLGPFSAYSPDNFRDYNYNKYRYMWECLKYTPDGDNGRWRDVNWEGALIESLRTYVEKCVGRGQTGSRDTGGGAGGGNDPCGCPDDCTRSELTGTWNCDDGGTYYIRQCGETVWWLGEGPGTPPRWSNVAYGTVANGSLALCVGDVPKGAGEGFGKLRLAVAGADELLATEKAWKPGGTYGGSRWWRGQKRPQGPGGRLSGLRWDIPCGATDAGAPSCPCADPESVTTNMDGEAGAVYDVVLRFRGVVEVKAYSEGSNDGAFWQVGGTPAGDTFNIYRLEISEPAQVFYLNRGVRGPDRTWRVDYTKTIRIATGARVTLSAKTLDSAQLTNRDEAERPIVVEGVVPAPAAYNGQFIQMDVVGVTPVR